MCLLANNNIIKIIGLILWISALKQKYSYLVIVPLIVLSLSITALTIYQTQKAGPRQY